MTHVHLGVALDGVGWHPAAWRDDTENAKRLTDPEYWVDLAQTAERGLLDFLTIDDTLALQSETYGPPIPRTDRVRGRLDSVLIASRIAPRTKHIGLIPTAVVTHTEPFHLAKAIATLDFVSSGRAGVRLKVGVTGTEAKLIGRRHIPELTLSELKAATDTSFVTDAFDEAVDYGEVLHRLWDSWEDDAEIRDQSTGRFIDRNKLHYIDFEGRHFSVKGPLTVPRPPQGQPIVGVLAHSTDVYRLGVAVADLIWFTPRSNADVRSVSAEIVDLAAASERNTPPAKVFGDLVVVLDPDRERAVDRLHHLDELSGEPLASDADIFTGTPSELADLVEAWTTAGLDGIRLRPASNAIDLPLISEALVPELQHRGLRPDGYSANTLRGNLGLDRPRSRYATSSEVS
ncbi:LLM class flavin-dependent oxidoreductase [Williamsia sp. 1135]|uniref:LLM class flavin-dependent oxidoreductase n=1 Tax=Williamsia sp. 1135 TaxID=1889262 RepID=UPI000A0FC33B|nr:LLM class flavin-dependent oxidoreductase [Williamsia sp. 1135]ORM26969.1 FMNH2-dependent monooxygenase [Williamsia sp. 1135]